MDISSIDSEEVAEYPSLIKRMKTLTPSQLLYPIEGTTRDMALNRFDISNWEKKFLMIWLLRKRQSFLTTTELFSYLNVVAAPMLVHFFSYNFYKVSINDFLQFVMIFGFGDLTTLLPFFYSITGIHSHKYVNEDQIYKFIRYLNLTGPNSISLIRFFLSSVEKEMAENDGRILLKTFERFLMNHIELFSIITILSSSIIHTIIEPEQFIIIKERQEYYYSHQSDDYITLPRENCINSFCRRVFLHQPHPYRVDFYSRNEGEEMIRFDAILLSLRDRYNPNFRTSKFASLKRRISKQRSHKNSLIKDAISDFSIQKEFSKE